MPTGVLTPVPRLRVWTNLLASAPGALLYTYRSGTTTPSPVYADALEAAALPNPVVADSGGLFPAIYLASGISYRFTLTQSDGTAIWGPVDNVTAGPGTAGIFNVLDYGAAGTGTTDDTAAIQAAITAAVAAGNSEVYLPGGTYKLSSAITVAFPITLRGAGPGLTSPTVLRIDSVAAHGIVVSTGGVHLRELKVTSATGARTGAGIHYTNGAGVPSALTTNVAVTGHSIGFWNEGSANEFFHCVANTNTADGFRFDGQTNAQNEVGAYFCQANGNTAHGFAVGTAGLGIRLVSCTAASNGGFGILAQATNTGGIGDLWITAPEISSNVSGGISLIKCTQVIITGGLCELSTIGPNITITAPTNAVQITGMQVNSAATASGHGILCDGVDIGIANCLFFNNIGSAIVHGTNAARVTLANNLARGNAVGVRFDGGTSLAIVGGNYLLNTAVSSGGVPAASRISAAIGFADA